MIMEKSTDFSKEFFARCRENDNEAWRELILAYDETITRWLARMGYWLGTEEIADLR